MIFIKFHNKTACINNQSHNAKLAKKINTNRRYFAIISSHSRTKYSFLYARLVRSLALTENAHLPIQILAQIFGIIGVLLYLCGI